MDNAAIVAQALAQRERWVELEPGLRVRVRRPFETVFWRYAKGVSVDDAIACVVGWEGFSEATVLGAAIGSSDPLPFAPEVWDVLARDRFAWVQKVADAVAEAVRAHIAAAAETAKN